MPSALSKSFALILSLAAAAAHAETRVNAAHFAPFAAPASATAVSINVNGAQVLTGVVFDQVSGYLALSGPGVAPGSTQVDVYAPPGAATPAISGTFDLAADTDYTVAAIGTGTKQPLALLPLVDDNAPPAAGNVKLRVVHAAPFAQNLADTAVSVRTEAGDVVAGLSNVAFGQASGYFELPAGTYDLKIATPDGATKLIDPAPVTLAAGTVATLFAVGDGSTLPLGITAVFGDGSSAPLQLAPAPAANAVPAPTLGTVGIVGMATALVLVALAQRRRRGLRA
jgi:hypothetical protein